jgi:hypothetical protein
MFCICQVYDDTFIFIFTKFSTCRDTYLSLSIQFFITAALR